MAEYVALTKKELRRSWFLWWKYCLCVFGFERLQAPGMTLAQLPIIEKYYKDDKDGMKRVLNRHRVFYNTEPQTGAIITGMVVSFEENIANGKEISDDFIQNVKVGLMGPFAGIGDSIMQATVPPIVTSIAIGLSAGGSIIGPIFSVVWTLVFSCFVSYTCFNLGYRLGEDAIDYILGPKMAAIQDAMSVLGLTVTGAITASYVSMNLALTYQNDMTTVSVQNILDGIFPKLLPIGLVFLGYWLMTKKKWNAIHMILLLLGVSIVGVLLGIL